MALLGGFIGGGIVWLWTRPKIQGIEERLTRLESLEQRVWEFEQTYQGDVKKIEDEYTFLWNKIQELQKATSQIPETRERLEKLFSSLETVTDSKLNEKGYRLAHIV
jgi:predicted RNase H-like nuclease (RuvC/YqgF family)